MEPSGWRQLVWSLTVARFRWGRLSVRQAYWVVCLFNWVGGLTLRRLMPFCGIRYRRLAGDMSSPLCLDGLA